MTQGRSTWYDFVACNKLTADLRLSCTSQKMSYDFKGVSMRGPGSGDICHLTDFNETWPD